VGAGAEATGAHAGGGVRRRPLGRRIFWLVPLLVAPVPFFVNPYIQFVINLILVYVLVGVGFNIVIGNLGQLAFGNVAFFGLGAYTSGILVVHAGWPWWTTVLPAALVGALAGALASLPALRRIRLFYLAILTMAFGELMRWIYIRAEPLTHGSMGLAVPPPVFLGIRLGTDRAKFYVFLGLVVVVVLLTSSLLRSRFGRAFMAIKDNEIAAAAMGIPTGRYFVLAFAWSGFVVGIGGATYTALIGHVTPEAFNLLELILHFAVVMVGGLGSLAGSVVGAVVLTTTPELFRDFPGFQELVLAALIILVLLFFPRGLVSLLAGRLPVFRERYERD
jgi:branched-chain amino acid transport system permease protein